MSDYDSDILAWSDEQAALLRRVAAGERVNEATLDWANIIEEIESVGRSELSAVESLIYQALSHMLKAEAWPWSRDVPHWRAEARVFRRQAKRKFTASMRQKISLAELYGDALAGLPVTLEGRPPLSVPDTCPLMLDDLLAQAPDFGLALFPSGEGGRTNKEEAR